MTVYLNGEFMPVGEARVSVMDRGFLFGDGVYEVIPVYSRRPFRLAEHLCRLQASLDGIRLPDPHTSDEWAALIERMIELGVTSDQSIYLQVTRGPAPVRNHAFPKAASPTVFMMGEPLATPTDEQRREGVAAVSAADIRWLRCDLKTTSLLANCLLRQRAIDAGCVETVLFRDGILTEGAASNVFAVRNDVLLAPKKDHRMLPGITYDVVLELAAAHGLPCEVRDVREDEVREASELWLTSSTREVLPIVRLDGAPVGTGRPGPLCADMHRWYQEFKQTVMRSDGG
ncbi:MAG: D-amino acid aminotransferase [Candidatus Nitricoxidivorans perseverans]|uniref:D-amino acid aminotransferase n=1 Tax=Candidatus Nitricoxidivorans perseverans TaxID=2975601 RepID=A0AA49FK11_9PROT|nr:MAG: D-amino acid aminotransferase [Candidatus Nitricoxidivorans perseverans]